MSNGDHGREKVEIAPGPNTTRTEPEPPDAEVRAEPQTQASVDADQLLEFDGTSAERQALRRLLNIC